MARPEKTAAVKEMVERFGGAEAMLLTEYRGLKVADIAAVRAALKEAGADYKVLKNTLARIAVREVGLDDLVALFEGPTAVAFVRADPAAAAKALDEAARRFPVMIVKGGVVAGRVIDAEGARRLASLEPRDVQLAKIAMLMNQPAQLTVNALAGLLRDLGSLLGQMLAKREEEGGDTPAAEKEE